MNDELSFHRIGDYPAQVNGPCVLVRLLDGLGFRLYWATQGLTAQEYTFSAGPGSQSIGQLIGHIWGLVNWVSLSVLDQKEQKPQTPQEQRIHALRMLHRLRERFTTLDDRALAEITIDGHPFWHILNGPLADALTHVGQINILRRLAGNPTPRAGLFTGEPPGAGKPKTAS